MFARMRLWWQELEDQYERECFEEESRDWENGRRREEELRLKYAGKCPACGTELDIGITERTVGRTCPDCGYHDFSFLQPEIE